MIVFSFYRVIGTLSILCNLVNLILLLLIGRFSMMSVELSLLIGIALCLLLPTKAEESKKEFCWSVALVGVLVVCGCLGGDALLIVGITLSFMCVHGIYRYYNRVKDIKRLFSQKSIWSSIQSESYLVMLLVYILLSLLVLLSKRFMVLRVLTIMILSLLYALLWYRIRRGYYLCLRPKKEDELRLLINSRVGPSIINEAPTKTMKDLWDKLQKYMSQSQAYLKKNYSLVDLSIALYTNKTYISRTINAMSGSNFRTFINKQRIEHAKKLIREQPHLRVEDVAQMSGFNTPVTYSMVFKQFVGITPGEYSIKIRSHLMDDSEETDQE